MVVVSVLGFCLLLAVDVPTARADFTFGQPVNLGPTINSTGTQRSPCLSADGLELYFARWESGTHYDLYVARRATVDSEWGVPVNLGPPINTGDQDHSPAISADGLTLYFIRSFHPTARLYMTKRATTNDNWGAPVLVGGAVNTDHVGPPCVSADDLELYFAAIRPGGYGNSDLWVTRRATVSDEWGTPTNLGPAINSSANEVWPAISPDGLLLFFSSDRLGGFGGYDIYVTKRATRDDPWGPPMNLGPVINTTSLDAGPNVSFDGSTLYFYSGRPGSYGEWDIWQAPILPIVDFNGDGKVDGADLDLLVAHWGTDEPLYDIGPFPWGDGMVDEQDLKILMESLMTPGPKASDVPCNTVLSWVAPSSAESQDVYFGTSFEAVSGADRDNPQDVLVSQGQTQTAYTPPEVLQFSQTYYWRVDFVIPGPTPAVYSGPVLKFTTEAFAYPLTNITATASSAQSDSGPQNTVNRSGLNAQDQHSTDSNHMWLSRDVLPAWIQFEFDQVCKLHEMWVWNYNHSFEPFIGWGAKDVKIEYSLDGENWTELEDVPQFTRAPGQPTYTSDTRVPFDGVSAKYVRLTIEDNWGIRPETGLSEVRFFQIPIQARAPIPADGATGVAIDANLTWQPGREAQSHQVYFGAEAEAVAAGAVPAASQTTRSYTPAALDLATTYYWRVDEVGETGTFEGNLWSFTTQEFLVVEDFERYNDKGNRIYETWIDGEVNKTGSTVGYTESSGGTFGERTLVHSGRQSMPLAYANVGSVTDSGATLSFDEEQDWTAHGATTLVVYFRGSLGNSAAQLYLKVNDTRVNYDGDPASLAMPVWKQWDVDLTSLGAAARSVRTLTIGVSGPGSGQLYVDDIRLHTVAPPASGVPVDPGTGSLAAYYAMENDAQDGSGNDRHGTMIGGCGFGRGPAGYGQALTLDGISGHVTLSIGRLVQSLRSTTIATWVNWAGGGAWQRIFDFGNNMSVYMFLTPSSGAGTLRFGITTSSNPGESMVQAPAALPSGWHHVAVTIDGDTKEMKLYLDGQLVGSSATARLPEDLGSTMQNWLGRSQWPDPYFNGSLDDFRIYNRALSEAEVRYLVGDR
jgi:hypothetical protein